MTKEEIGQVLLMSVGETLYRWTVSGVEYGVIHDGRPKMLPPGTARQEAERRAAEIGCELLEVASSDGMLRLGSALAQQLLKSAESHVAEVVAKGAGKA